LRCSAISSAHQISPYFTYGREPSSVRTGLGLLHIAGEVLAAVILAAGVVLAAKALRRGWRERKLSGLPWIPLYFFFQLSAVLGRLILLAPKPFVEPRHNLDLTLLLVLSSFFAADALARRVRWTRGWTAGIVALSLALGLPSAFYFHKMARFKRVSYQSILGVLRENGVKYLAADFTIAHVIHFLTGRRIEVTDSIGPVMMDVAFPEMNRAVEALPDEQKAYFFFRPSYPRVHAIQAKSQRSRDQLIHRLREKGIPYKAVRLKFYELIIPESSRLGARPPS